MYFPLQIFALCISIAMDQVRRRRRRNGSMLWRKAQLTIQVISQGRQTKTSLLDRLAGCNKGFLCVTWLPGPLVARGTGVLFVTLPSVASRPLAEHGGFVEEVVCVHLQVCPSHRDYLGRSPTVVLCLLVATCSACILTCSLHRWTG